jgi:non-specific serine/threonine protein kinase
MAIEPFRKRSTPDVAISLERGCLLRGGQEIRLRAKTFHVLAYLHEHRGRLVPKEDLFRAVWPDTFVSDDSLTKCIREIREALGDGDHQLLKTVARRGFILDAPLVTDSQASLARIPATIEPSDRHSHNLPAPLTSFIGRQQEIAELVGLLPSARLLTLTGAGGSGKTRLALQVARQVLDRFSDGVWLADLAPLAEPALVAQTVASILEVRQAPNRTLVETLSDQLRNRRLLLVLDNCEHLITASAELAETLLRASAGLTILATSREALGIAGETTWRVPSLTLPDPDLEVRLPPSRAKRAAASLAEANGGGGTPDPTNRSGDLLAYEAIQLLVARAAAVDSGFTITSGNAGTVADVCRRLDGIPLAIELAAARLKVLSIEQIHARLDDRFRLLASTQRAAIGRQRTLEATVDWSYDLLSDDERLLLRRLSAFAGGWTLEAAEHVCAGDAIEREEVLDLMSRLVDKSLVTVDEGAGGRRRYRYLETVRQYAWERLQQSGEADAVRARHFEFFLDLARGAEPELWKAEQLQWLDRLQIEHDNIRAALEWGLASDRSGSDALELAARLQMFWTKRNYLAEGRHWLERAFAGCAACPAARRAHALTGLGGIVFFQGDFDRAKGLLEEAGALALTTGDPATAALAFGILTYALLESGDFAGAARRASESMAAARASGDPSRECWALSYYALEAQFAGDIDRAGRLHEQTLAQVRAAGELWGIAIVLVDLAIVRVVQQRLCEARALSSEGISLGRKFGDRLTVAWHLGVLAGADAAEGRPARAARLRGAMEGLLDSIGSEVQPSYHQFIGDRLFGAVQQDLGPDAYQQELAAGRAMSLSQAIELAGEAAAGPELTA